MWQGISCHDWFDFSPSNHYICSHEANNYYREFVFLSPLRIQTPSPSCNYSSILLLSRYPWIGNTVQHFSGAGITTNPFYGHIFSFDHIEILTLRSNGMTPQSFSSLDLHAGNHDSVWSTSLIERNHLAQVKYLWKTKARAKTIVFELTQLLTRNPIGVKIVYELFLSCEIREKSIHMLNDRFGIRTTVHDIA